MSDYVRPDQGEVRILTSTSIPVSEVPHGLYIVHWKGGGQSEAAVGSTFTGARWLAPTNWISAGSTDQWNEVDYIEKVEIP